ncbi:MAG: gliding motility-associated C-terminal domain-containing protein [Flavobacteriales bacterium]|nr:gliding motility-associated C-terminal domain-containing protein [Flavobacteriales bacterium]
MKKQIFTLSVAFAVGLLFSANCVAQPANDACSKADIITVSSNGFDTGIFVGSKVDVTHATREIGEICDAEIQKLGNCEKTVWYAFYIATTRNVEVSLKQQDSAIPQIFSGFTIYRTVDCGYNVGNISKQLVPLAKFGKSGNACLKSGYYFVQVASKSKAKGELWVEVNISKPAYDVADDHNVAYDLGVVEGWKTYGINAECHSITKDEKIGIGNDKYTKSSWYKFTLKGSSNYDRVILSADLDSFMYRIFRGKPTTDSLRGSSNFSLIYLYKSPTIIDNFCKSGADDSTYYIQCIGTNNTTYFWLSISSFAEVKDTWNFSKTPLRMSPKARTNLTQVHHFNCEGLMANQNCSGTMPDYYTYTSSISADIDTANYAAYMLLDCQEEGELTIYLEDDERHSIKVMYVLYEGDITQSCNLKEIERFRGYGLKTCLEKKVYTLLIAHEENQNYYKYVKLNVRLDRPTINFSHFHHTDVEFVGRVDPDLNIYPQGKTINFHYRDTTFQVDTFKLKGRMIFREIYFPYETNEVVLGLGYSQGYNGVYSYLLEGRISDSSIKVIPELVAENGFYQLPKACATYKKGYYTIITLLDTAYQDYRICAPPTNSFRVSPISICTAVSPTEYQNAAAINNNNNLLSNSGAKQGLSYIYPLSVCKDCSTKTNLKPQTPSCFRYSIDPDSIFAFYTFYIDTNCSITIPPYSLLYEGNVKADSSIMLDTNNILSPCYGTTFCNLKGKKIYTIIVSLRLGKDPWTVTATPLIKSPNDFAKNAADLGHINSGTSSSSTFMPITCGTTVSITNPRYYNYESFSEYKAGEIAQVQGNESINTASNSNRGNIWFTFTVSGSTDITLNVNSLLPLCKEKITVWKYTGFYNASFSGVLTAGLDSTLSGMQYVGVFSRQYSTECIQSQFKFSNIGCVDTRYFVIIDYSTIGNEYKLKISSVENTQYSSTGDFCKNAISKVVNKLGTYSLTTPNNCHTYGNSPFENDENNTIKSSWFRIKIENLTKCDLSISYTGNVSITGYNVYGGNCGAMTKVAQLNDKFSYFTLSCMGAGEYFVQAISPVELNGNVSFDFKIDTSENAKCKPYNFDEPLAQFDLKGGCNNDTIDIINISTNGDSIVYKWLLNNQFFDTVFDPLLLKTFGFLRDTNALKLIVLNTESMVADTFEKQFVIDTTTYFLSINEPKNWRCDSIVTLSVSTNYPERLNYEWTNYSISDKYAEMPTYWPRYDEKIYLKAGNEFCQFFDTVNVKLAIISKGISDTLLCESQNELYLFFPNSSVLSLNNVNVVSPIRLTEPGEYVVRQYTGGCHYVDTFLVNFGEKYDTLSVLDTTSICPGQTIVLKWEKPVFKPSWSDGSKQQQLKVNHAGHYQLKADLPYCLYLNYDVEVEQKNRDTSLFFDTLRLCNHAENYLLTPDSLPNYLWNTGDTFSSIAVSKAGNFSMQSLIDLCTISEYRFAVYNDSVPNKFLTDTVVCAGNIFDFNPKINNYEIRYLSPNNPIIPTKKTVLIATIGLNACEASDTAVLSVIPINSHRYIMKHCFEDSLLTLDAGQAQAYLWKEDLSTNRYLLVYDFGLYTVFKETNAGCTDTSSFNILSDCAIKVYIPNSFSPNDDGLNSTYGPIVYHNFDRFEMSIYNRWGEKIFETKDSENWNGMYLGELVQPGLYLGLIEIVSGETIYRYSTEILLVR